jgi:hypothetical protein
MCIGISRASFNSTDSCKEAKLLHIPLATTRLHVSVLSAECLDCGLTIFSFTKLSTQLLNFQKFSSHHAGRRVQECTDVGLLMFSCSNLRFLIKFN